MILKRVHLINYRIHEDKAFDFDKGFNEIKEPNEYGKSTIIEAIQDAFSLKPSVMGNKATRGIDKNPVVEVEFQTPENLEFMLIANAQDNSITLKGKDGTYLTDEKKIKEFFKRHGYGFFHVVVPMLLVLRERDLSIATDSRDFKKFTRDILKVDRLNGLHRILGDLLLKDKQGFKQSLLKYKFSEFKNEKDELRSLISELEGEIATFSDNKHKADDLTHKLEEKKKKLDEANKLYAYLDVLVKYKRKHELLEKKQALCKEIDDSKSKFEQSKSKAAELEEKRNLLNAEKDKKKIQMTRALNAEKRKHEIEKLKKSINEHIVRKNRIAELIKQNEVKLEKHVNAYSKIMQTYKDARRNYKKLEDQYNKITTRVEIAEKSQKELKSVSLKLAKVNEKLSHAGKLENTYIQLKNALKKYEKWNVSELEKAFSNWQALLKMEKSTDAAIYVKKGSVTANSKTLKKGQTLEFKGELDIKAQNFNAIVYAKSNIKSTKDSLVQFIAAFQHVSTLEQIIKDMKELEKIEYQLGMLEVPELEREKSALSKQLQEIKQLGQDLKIYRDKQKKIELEKNDAQNKVNNISKKIGEHDSNIKNAKREIDSLKDEFNNINDSELRKEIEKLNRELEEMSKFALNVKNIQDEIIDLEKRLDEIEKWKKENFEVQGALKQVIQTAEKEHEDIKAKLQELPNVDDDVDKIPYGVVKKYKDAKSIDIEAELVSLRDKISDISDSLKRMEIEVAELNVMLSNVPDVGKLKQKRKKLLEVERKYQNMQKMEKMMRVAKAAVLRLRETLEQTYLNGIEDESGKYFSRITAHKYGLARLTEGTIFLESEDFKTSWQVEDKYGNTFGFSELSDGTKTQLLLSIRLAFISKFLGDRKAFLLLDEPFAYSDAQREANTRKILKDLTRSGWQIILFSAKARDF